VTDSKELQRECRLFTQYLLGCAPDTYVERKYIEAHETLSNLAPANRFDIFLIGAARRNSVLLKLADAYAGIFDNRGLLRRKLVLLFAILETSPPFFQKIDAVDGEGRFLLACSAIVRGVISVLSLIAGAILFVPASMILRGPAGAKK
jgi:hypothetical protein